MTTLAYKDNVIAYDSRVTQGPKIASNKFNKKLYNKFQNVNKDISWILIILGIGSLSFFIIIMI